MNVEYVPVKDLIPYARNPRKNDAAVDAVAESIKAFGFRNPIIVDAYGVVIAGHTRLKAAKKLGMKTVPVICADDLTPEQAKAFRLVDNKTAELAEWDTELLDIELADIELDMEPWFDMGEETETQEAIEDDYEPELPEEPKAKRGQIYKLGRHRLMCGDSTKAEDVEKLMGGAKADMVFTDPPYGVSYTDKNDFLNSIDKPICVVNAIENDDKSPEEMHDFWIQAFSNLYRFTKDRMSYYITAPQGGDLLLLLEAVRECGFALKHQLIWNKNNHVLGRCDYNYKHEPIIYGWKLKGTHDFYGNGTMKTSVWDVPKPLRNDLHPTMKPVELIVNALLNSSNDNDIVLDLFGGSGSTLIACEQTERNCYMMEYEPHYIDVIIDRWEKFTGEKAELISE